MAIDKGPVLVAEIAGIVGGPPREIDEAAPGKLFTVKHLKSGPAVWFDGEQHSAVTKYVDDSLVTGPAEKVALSSTRHIDA